MRNQNIKIPTVIASINKPAKRFSNQTRISPINAVRKGRNIYMEEFYRRIKVNSINNRFLRALFRIVK